MRTIARCGQGLFWVVEIFRGHARNLGSAYQSVESESMQGTGRCFESRSLVRTVILKLEPALMELCFTNSRRNTKMLSLRLQEGNILIYHCNPCRKNKIS